jgi:hypothetical protein
MRAFMLIVAASLVLAGCSSPSSDDTTVDDRVPFSEDRGRGNITVDVPTLPTLPPLPGERTLATAPQLRLGEWWQIKLVDHFTFTEYNLMRVVAGTEHGNYLIGFPIDEFSNDALVLHTPGYGDILPDLSYGAHDVPFVPVQFPIVPGATWRTAWEAEGNTMDMLVEEAAAGKARIIGTPVGGGYATTIEYDAEIGEVRKLVMQGYAEYEVIDHGYGYTGDVRVPHAHDLVFLNGRVAALHDASKPLGSPTPAAPTETITVGEGYDRISFAILMFDVPALLAKNAGAPSVAPAGAYAVRLTAPDGTLYEDSFTAADSGWIKGTFFGHEGPSGDWQLVAAAGGAGAAFVEGIGYHSIDIALPSGCVLASAAANHHGTLCGDERRSQGLPQ